MCARTLFLLAFSLAAAVSSYAMGAPVEQQDHFWERFLEGDVSFPTRPPTPGPQATPDPSPAPMPEPTPSPTTETLAPSPVEADCFGFQLKVTCENRNPGASSTSCDDIPATQCEGLEVCDYNVTFVYEVEAPLGADPLTVVSLTSVIPQAELLLNFTGGQQFDHRNPFLLETNITLDLAMQKNYTVLSSIIVVGSDDSCADTDFFRFTAGRLAAPMQDPTPVPTPQPTIKNFCIVEATIMCNATDGTDCTDIAQQCAGGTGMVKLLFTYTIQNVGLNPINLTVAEVVVGDGTTSSDLLPLINNTELSIADGAVVTISRTVDLCVEDETQILIAEAIPQSGGIRCFDSTTYTLTTGAVPAPTTSPSLT